MVQGGPKNGGLVQITTPVIPLSCAQYLKRMNRHLDMSLLHV